MCMQVMLHSNNIQRKEQKSQFSVNWWTEPLFAFIFIHFDYKTGDELALYNFNVNDDVVILTGNGLGGTSLINANVALEATPQV